VSDGDTRGRDGGGGFEGSGYWGGGIEGRGRECVCGAAAGTSAEYCL
jgi:hypothetical protein